MPSVSLTVPRTRLNSGTSNPFPSLLHTPSGLAVVEIQGSVLSETRDSGNSNRPLQLGRLIFPPPEGQHEDSGWDGKRVFLFVERHQRLAGEVKKLSKPLAVIRRKAAGDQEQDDAASTVDDLEIAEIVYYKLLFAHRPEPVGASVVQNGPSDGNSMSTQGHAAA